MLRFLTCLLFTPLGLSSISAQIQVDSLQNLLAHATSDTTKANLFHKIGSFFDAEKSLPDSAIFYFEKGLNIARKSNFTEGAFDNLFGEGLVYQYLLQDEATAFSIYNQCIAVAKKSGTDMRLFRVYYSMAIVSDHQGNAEKFFEYTKLAQSVAEKLSPPEPLTNILSAYGTFYETHGQLDRAEIYYKKAYDFAKTKPVVEDTKLMTLSNMANLYQLKKQDAKASEFYNEMLNLTNKNKNSYMHLNALLSLGNISFNEKRYAKSLEFASRVIEKTGNKSSNFQFVIADAYLLRAKNYEELKDFKSAYFNYKIGDTLRDSLEKENEKNDMNVKTLKLQSQFDLENKQKEVAVQSLYTWLALMIVGLITIFSFFLFRNYRLKKQQNKQLERQQAELERLNSTKDKLFSIISHDLRAPLSGLKGLLTLWDAKALSPEKFGEISEKVKNNVNILYISLENLLQWAYSQLRGIEPKFEKFNVYDIVETEMALLKENAKTKNIVFAHKMFGELFVEADVNQVGIVIRNLISNAIKFTPLGGQVNIESVIEKNEKEVRISVTDTGVGMSPNLMKKLFNAEFETVRRGTANEKGTGLGLMIAKEFVEANNGILSVESVENEGTCVSFTLKMA